MFFIYFVYIPYFNFIIFSPAGTFGVVKDGKMDGVNEHMNGNSAGSQGGSSGRSSPSGGTGRLDHSFAN